MISGSLDAVLENFLANEDLHIFDDGNPYVGAVVPMDPDFYSGLGSVVKTAMDTYDRPEGEDRNSVNVTAVEGEDGNVRYIASIPGTAEGTMGPRAWMGALSGLDWAANLMHYSNGPTSATQASSQAIQDGIAADIAYRKEHGMKLPQGTPEVLLAGHSQGGIIAGQLTTNDEFLTGLNVTGILSMGSPVEALPLNPNIPVYNFQSQHDPIPEADLAGERTNGDLDPAPNVTNITLPHSGSWWNPIDYTPWYTHQQDTYEDDIKLLQTETTDSPATQGLNDMNDEFGVFFVGETTSHNIEFGRQVDN